ncbi:hypothetical protein D3C87_1530700 [compost metagenome]
MTANENNKLEIGHVIWLANNNEQEYRGHEVHPRPAPAEVEVSEIVQAELVRILKRFMYEHGMNIDDAPDQRLAKRWLEEQVPSDEFYAALKKLEMIFNINQIVSILSDVQTQGVVVFHTNIENESEYSVSLAFRSIA